MSWHRAGIAVSSCLALFMTASRLTAGEAASAIPVIAISAKPGGIEIAASVLGFAEEKLTGEVSIDRTGKSGTVATRQSRDLALAPGESASIATTGISFGEGDTLSVRVTLSRRGEVVGEATVSMGGS